MQLLQVVLMLNDGLKSKKTFPRKRASHVGGVVLER